MITLKYIVQEESNWLFKYSKIKDLIILTHKTGLDIALKPLLNEFYVIIGSSDYADLYNYINSYAKKGILSQFNILTLLRRVDSMINRKENK